MAPPSKRPPQGRKPAQGKRPTQSKRPPQARKPAQTSKPATAGAPSSDEVSVEADAATTTKAEAAKATKSGAAKATKAGAAKATKADAATATKAPPSAETSRIAEERKAKREAARQERIALARQKQKAKRRKQMLIAGVLVVGLLGAVVYGVQKSRGQKARASAAAEEAGCGPVDVIKDQGRNHIPLSQTFTDYNSNPPTSGPHYAERVANWGSYNEETPQTTLVHNLEHGGIVIHYKGQTDDQVDEIDSFVESYQDGVISNPNEKIDKPIVIASWNQLQKCERFNPDAVAGYIQEYCNKGPEKLTTCRH